MFFITVRLESCGVELVSLPMKSLLLPCCLALSGSLLSTPAGAQATARDAILRADPQAGAREVARLAAGTRLAILKRDGFWVQAGAGGARGWLRMTELSFAQPGGAANLATIDSGRLGKHNIVASSAARGLSADELRQAAPDFAAVAALASLGAEPAALRAFRNQGGLDTVTVAPLRLRAAAVPATAQSAPSTTAAKGAANEDW